MGQATPRPESSASRPIVVGVRLGEVAVAFVIPRAGQAVGAEDRQAYCRDKLAGFTVPRHVWVVDDVPRTPGPHGDKVQKARLREQALRALGRAPHAG